MELQLLVSAVGQDPVKLADDMNISSEAVIINQTDCFGYEEFTRKGYRVRSYSFREKGVGLSRNNALLRADKDICLFSDEDIRYTDDYRELVLKEFEKAPDADLILFNVEAVPSRRTYHIENYGRVGLHNCGRYPAYSFAARTGKLHKANITYSLLFGGGARYSNGEDSLFIRDCIRGGLRVIKAPVTIGWEEERPSTWFHGYTEKFFFDRGVLYHYLYGCLAKPLALRFLLKNKEAMCGEIPLKKAYALMCDGLREAKG